MSLLGLATNLKYGIDGLVVRASIRGGRFLLSDPTDPTPSPNSGDSAGWLKDAPSNDLFVDAKATTENVGKSAYGFTRTLGIVVLLVGIVMAAIGIAVSKGGNNREEGKSKLVNVIFGGALIFGAIGIITIIISIGNGLNPSTT